MFLQVVYSSLTQEQAVSNEYGSQSSSCSGSDSGFPVALREQLGMLLSTLPSPTMNGNGSLNREQLQQNGGADSTVMRRGGLLSKGN